MRNQAGLERMAGQLLRRHHITKPPVNVWNIAEALGIEVREQASADSSISGALMREGGLVIIGVNGVHPITRKRFTVAHELAHFLLHDDSLRVDHHYVEAPAVRRPMAFRNQVSSLATDANEIEANRLAAALVMPKDFLERSLKKLDLPLSESDIRSLTSEYGVSFQAMNYRLINLGVPLDLAGHE